MRIALPTKVNILGIPFDVVYTDLDSEELMGDADGPAHKIRVNSKIPKHLQVSYLIHEILHGALYISGNSDRMDDDKGEESIVVALQNAIYGLLRDHPDLVKLIR